ncbi:Sugar kinase of the NBD/HSP70 family, may contain an N-terminal HTH domain [Meinhardsimonia xiamenensis]|jgi:predicted NBD/HSP70 family sugar kinase|uniref:Sugar kinase of the NBD/HSP70 family, may contain an N-terminal HTH domain n=2 Tax=Meinhardsimonia xiamenensis TaxID=990712 RepID=A0A1G9BIW5_9RHOB|nr:ROK family transcriptional regulator [Meinhardsimonia xiamenensis]PRX34964.1 MarR family transcriptional regulator [Meinhardsimonia xiamenensis]SDK39397.1 Sugar kinase of the NBD/HSP70 family, may contain an N-terminal HTH domain [Meinhardsimonia xiamenensis]
MVRIMDGDEGRIPAGGANQSRIRDHNERLILSLLLRKGARPGSDIARLTGLSPQTVSIILRELERDGLVSRGEPVRGKVGKPSIPMQLNPDGVMSLGLRVGRRSADLLLLDFRGHVRWQIQTTYAVSLPRTVFAFLRDGLEAMRREVPAGGQARIAGIGVGIPFEMWRWNQLSGDSAREFRSWKDIDFPAEVRAFTDLPVFMVNDATAAAHAEHLFGRGAEFRDYAYFFIGSFTGGGVVLNGSVYEGNRGNAGALGALRTTGPQGESQQLIDVASLHVLERRLIEVGIDPAILWHKPQDWSAITRHVEPWIGQTAQELAKAALSVCSVIDFEAVLIDGAFPEDVREELVARVRRYIVHQDMRGLIAPRIEAGAVGENARGIGAAAAPVLRQFLLDTNAAFAFR